MEFPKKPDMMGGILRFSELSMRHITNPVTIIPIVLLILVSGLVGQDNPVSWTVKAPTEVTAGEAFQVEVSVTIEAPYHIYGLGALDTGVPTSFKASNSKRARVGKTVKPSRDADLHADEFATYSYWENEISFSVPVTIGGTEAEEKHTFDLVMDYMACTNEGCLPPMSLTRTIAVKVKEGKAAPSAPVGGGVSPGPFGVPGLGDTQHPVRIVSTELSEVEGGQFNVTVEVMIDKPYHIYGFDHEDGPTTFRISGADRLEVIDEPGVDPEPELHEATAEYDTDYWYWEGAVTFVVPVGIDEAKDGEKFSFKLVIDHLACDDKGCLPPRPIEKDLEVTVPEGGGGDGIVEEETGEPVDGGATDTEPGEGGPAPKAEMGVQASFDGDPTPGRGIDLLVTLPEGVGTAAAAVKREQLILLRDELAPAGDGVIEASADGLRVRIPVTVKEGLKDQAEIKLRGILKVDGASVKFHVDEVVDQSIAAFLLLAAGAAALALLTPCVFPMIPITVSFFTKQAETSPFPPVTLGTIYSLGIVLSFTAIGVIFTLAMGPQGAIRFAQSPITLGAIAVLFIVFALSLFGMFELQLPSGLMNLVGKAQGKGGLIGVWLLGLLFAVTSFTCTAPFVGTILAGAASSGEWTRPVLGMVVFSGVLAIPFFFLSIFPSRLKSMPRAGSWLNEVKVVMGFIELAAAFKFLGDMDGTLFTRFFILVVWTVVFGACGLYLLGFFRLPHDSPKEKVGVMGMMVGLVFLCLSIYCTKGLSGEPLNKEIDAYLPAEVDERTPIGRRNAIVKQMVALGYGAGGGARKAGLDGRVGYDDAYVYWKDGKVKDENPYESAKAEAKRLGTALFIDFTGFA